MLRKLAMMAGCLALVTIGLVTAETAGQPPKTVHAATASARATSSSAGSSTMPTASDASAASADANTMSSHDMMAMSEAAPTQAASQSRSTQPLTTGGPADLPAYHDKPSKDPLPATLDPMLFPDAMNQNIYALAAKEKKILYQQPCYCRCDREVGHRSLLDCYVDRHASVCSTCKMEAVFAYQEMKKGKTAAEIRQEIIDNKWQKVDLSPYAVAGAVKPDAK